MRGAGGAFLNESFWETTMPEQLRRTDNAPAQPTTPHGPPCRHVVNGPRHEGQTVQPVVRAWHLGAKGYLVQACWYDASDRTYSEPETYQGDFWECTRWLEERGILCDIDAA